MTETLKPGDRGRLKPGFIPTFNDGTIRRSWVRLLGEGWSGEFEVVDAADADADYWVRLVGAPNEDIEGYLGASCVEAIPAAEPEPSFTIAEIRATLSASGLAGVPLETTLHLIATGFGRTS